MDVLGFFITFRTYGSWLPGDARGSVDDSHNVPGTAWLSANPDLAAVARIAMPSDAVVLSGAARLVVETAISGVVSYRGYRGWELHALNVRSNHVHAVVSADARPERVMNDFKAWSTRRLVEAGLVKRGARVWARHGSTRWLNSTPALRAACDYVLEGQDVPR